MKQSTRHFSWAALAILVLAAIGGVVFLVLVVVRRSVEFEVVRYEIDQTRISFGLWGYRVPITVWMSALNDNFYDITLVRSMFEARHPKYSRVLANGSFEDVRLYRRQNEIPVTVELWMEYLFKADRDGYLNELVANCSETPMKKVYLNVEAKIDYEMFLSSGSMNESREMYIDCVDSIKDLALLQRVQAMPESITRFINWDAVKTTGKFVPG